MENDAFYNPTNSRSIPHEFDEHGVSRSAGWIHDDQIQPNPRDDLDRGSNLYDGRRFKPAQTFDYDHMVDRCTRWKDEPKNEQSDDAAAWRECRNPTITAKSRYDDYDKQSSKYRDNKEYSDDPDRKSRLKGYGQDTEDPPGRRNRRSKSRDRERDRDSDRRDRDRYRDRERRNRRDETSYGNERDDSEYRPRRRSRSRDRDRSERDRRHRDSDRDRRHRDFDRGGDSRSRRDHDRDRGDRDRDTSPKEIPWVPPPLPEHLRHLQVQWALTPVAPQLQAPSSSSAIVTQPLQPVVQNQFQNDGSFMELFRQKMQEGAVQASMDDSSASEGPSTSGSMSSAVPEVSSNPPAAAAPAPSLPANSSGLPVIAKRRISKILKTGIVQKKKKKEEDEEDKGGDGWTSYMKEVQKYRANKCIENEASRPPLVK